jgi:hypothetical protein
VITLSRAAEMLGFLVRLGCEILDDELDDRGTGTVTILLRVTDSDLVLPRASSALLVAQASFFTWTSSAGVCTIDGDP